MTTGSGLCTRQELRAEFLTPRLVAEATRGSPSPRATLAPTLRGARLALRLPVPEARHKADAQDCGLDSIPPAHPQTSIKPGGTPRSFHSQPLTV